jgi:predicted YcjX-like family ATPase
MRAALIVLLVVAAVIAVGSYVFWIKVVRPSKVLLDAAELLQRIYAEFRPDSTTTMRDLLDRLEMAAGKVDHMLALVDLKITTLTAVAQRIEAQAERAATDLAASHERADSVTGVAGEAADAAAKSTNEPRP